MKNISERTIALRKVIDMIRLLIIAPDIICKGRHTKKTIVAVIIAATRNPNGEEYRSQSSSPVPSLRPLPSVRSIKNIARMQRMALPLHRSIEGFEVCPREHSQQHAMAGIHHAKSSPADITVTAQPICSILRPYIAKSPIRHYTHPKSHISSISKAYPINLFIHFLKKTIDLPALSKFSHIF